MKRRVRVLMLVVVIGIFGFLLTGCITLKVVQFSASPATGYAPLTVCFDAFLSSGDDIVLYEWHFGDGSRGTGKSVIHCYKDDSDLNNDGLNEGYTVVLVVTDSQGLKRSCSGTIYVYNPAPVAKFSFLPLSPLTLEETWFSAAESYDPAAVKPEGVIIEPIDNPTGEIVSYHWDFGDGSSGTGRIVKHTYFADGTWQVTLTVIDDDGAVSSTSSLITVRNRPPIANFDWGECSVDYGASSGAQPLNFEKEIHPKGISPEPIYRCIWFDGSSSKDLDGNIVTYDWSVEDYYNGKLVAYGSGKMVWGYFFTGSYRATLTVTDNDGATDSFTQWLSI